MHEGKQDLPAAVRDLIRPASAEAFSLKSFSRRTLKVRSQALGSNGINRTPLLIPCIAIKQEKLASVPCFLVCNQQGSPYLVPLETGFDVGVVFLDPADAEEMMQSMVQVRDRMDSGESILPNMRRGL